MPSSAQHVQPLDTLWQAPVIIWILLVGEGVAAVLAMASALDGNRWVYFGLASLAIQWICLLTLSCLYVLRRSLTQLKPLQIATLAMGLMLICTWAVCGAAWAMVHQVLDLDPRTWRMTLLRVTGIALTAGALGLLAFRSHWQARLLAVQAKQAQLEALRARIRPHFLFNTLNTSAALVHQHPEQAERLLLDLADLFRAALGNTDQVSLEEEIALTRRYLEIESARLGQRLRIEWEIPVELPAVQVPALLIQPLVENAIHHGIEASIQGGSIRIRINFQETWLKVEISNPLPSNPSQIKRGHQLGLEAVRARVENLGYGSGRLTIQHTGTTYISRLELPLKDFPASAQITSR